MCDYSLMSFPNRLAREGEELVVHRFPGGAKGLAASPDLHRETISLPGRRDRLGTFFAKLSSAFGLSDKTVPSDSTRPVMAVCVAPGTHLLLRDIAEALQDKIGVRRTEEVTFTQISATAFNSRDAMRFKNGYEIKLQQLMEGQRVRVLNLSSEEALAPELEVLPLAC
jgi:hypothetical protein